jgi:hydrogenase maturation protein HypF
VILSGGVWQNITLLMKTMKKLDKSNFNVFIHNQVPTNDGGLALGQAAIAYHNLINGDPM